MLPESRLIEIYEKVGGDTLYGGTASQNYIDANIFKKPPIGLIYQQYLHPVYKQLYGDFIPNFSVIDLIFNEDPNSLSILELNRLRRLTIFKLCNLITKFLIL